MTGYSVYGLYQAIKLHFTSKSYDFFTYGGKTRLSPESFEKRKDKYFFHKLARKYTEDEIMSFMVANFVYSETQWSKDLLSPAAHAVFVKWKRITESMSEVYKTDLKTLAPNKSSKEFDNLFKVQDGQYPVLLKAYLENDITIETLVILNKIFDFLKVWDNQIQDTVVYPKLAMKIRKYAAFLHADEMKYRALTKKVLLDD